MTYYAHVDSPLGRILLVADGERLTGLHFEGDKYQPRIASDWLAGETLAVVQCAVREIAEYFAGRRKTFTVPIAAAGTPFQRRVWQALGTIRCGTTATYAEVAHSIGAPKAVRAVGAAIGRNPVSIMVPCHRVIGSNGSLTGYAGGLDKKRALLALERVPVAG